MQVIERVAWLSGLCLIDYLIREVDVPLDLIHVIHQLGELCWHISIAVNAAWCTFRVSV